jgi:hypothetical protein
VLTELITLNNACLGDHYIWHPPIFPLPKRKRKRKSGATQIQYCTSATIGKSDSIA